MAEGWSAGRVSSCRGPGIVNLTRSELSGLKSARPSFAIGRVAQGYSQLMHGKGACHLVSPILWLSALARSAWVERDEPYGRY